MKRSSKEAAAKVNLSLARWKPVYTSPEEQAASGALRRAKTRIYRKRPSSVAGMCRHLTRNDYS